MGRGEMVAVVVMHRPDDRHPVHEPGVVGQELGDLHARHAGAHGLKRPAKLGGRLGLGVVGLVLRRAAVEPDQDDRAVRGSGPALRFRESPGAEQVRQAQAQTREPQRPALRKLRRFSPSHRRGEGSMKLSISQPPQKKTSQSMGTHFWTTSLHAGVMDSIESIESLGFDNPFV